MSKRTGVTATTVEQFLIGPGAVYKNWTDLATPGTLLGATIGGNQVTITREYHVPELDGALGPVKGTRRLIREVPVVVANLVEITKENLMLALAGATSADHPAVTPTHDLITSTGEIADLDYLTNIAIVGQKAGTDKPIVFLIENALSTEPVEINLGTGRDDDVVLQTTFTGHYDPATPNTPPYKIYSPK